jgi:hypothetical protein
MIACDVLHHRYQIHRLENVRYIEKANLHTLFRAMKRVLREVSDLRNVKIEFNADHTLPLSKFLLDVHRRLRVERCSRNIFFVAHEGSHILFAGLIDVRVD